MACASNLKEKTMKNKKLKLMLLIGLALSGSAQAALNDRGGGMLYDDVLNITWLQDANYAKTSGYAGANAAGYMNWTSANTWANDLVYGGYSDWRLATNTPVDGVDWNYDFTVDGSTDFGYNITSPHSELAYMYHVNLGLKSLYDTAGNYQADFGVFGNGTVGGQADVGLVKNLQSTAYWSGAVYAPDPANLAWYFHTHSGSQIRYYQDGTLAAWAVRPGDVAAVPEPGTYAMLLAGLGLVGAKVRRRRNQSV